MFTIKRKNGTEIIVNPIGVGIVVFILSLGISDIIRTAKGRGSSKD